MLQDEEKEVFARTWASIGDAWQAALTLAGPENAGKALLLSMLEFDTEVIARKDELGKEVDEFAGLPTKAELAAALIHEANNCRTSDTRHKYLRLYAEMRGFIVKEPPKANSGIVAIPMSPLDERL